MLSRMLNWLTDPECVSILILLAFVSGCLSIVLEVIHVVFKDMKEMKADRLRELEVDKLLDEECPSRLC